LVRVHRMLLSSRSAPQVRTGAKSVREHGELAPRQADFAIHTESLGSFEQRRHAIGSRARRPSPAPRNRPAATSPRWIVDPAPKASSVNVASCGALGPAISPTDRTRVHDRSPRDAATRSTSSPGRGRPPRPATTRGNAGRPGPWPCDRVPGSRRSPCRWAAPLWSGRCSRSGLAAWNRSASPTHFGESQFRDITREKKRAADTLQSQRREMLQPSRGPGSPRNSRPVLCATGLDQPTAKSRVGPPRCLGRATHAVGPSLGDRPTHRGP